MTHDGPSRTLSPEAFREACRTRGMRITRQREVIYAALAATRAHPTAEELLSLVRASEPGVSLATIYNTLDAFVRAGLCVRIPPTGTGDAPREDEGPGASPTSGANRYDADTTPHAHVIRRTGEVRDLPESVQATLRGVVDDDMLRKVSRSMGVAIDRVEIRLLEE